MFDENPQTRAIKRMRRFAEGRGADPADFALLGVAAVSEVEAKLRGWYGVKYALCVSNATDALRAIAIATEMRGKEFITTPLTWGGTVAEWVRLGNRPRFAGVDRATLTLSSSRVRRTITRRTGAILSVDIFGKPADMTTLRRLADHYGLWYISDASQSLGAFVDERPASSLAHAWVVSFGPGKGVSGGDGAAILTNDQRLYERLLWETQHPARHRVDLGLELDNEFAVNGRMNPWTAIWLAETFEAQLQRVITRQRRLVRRLRRAGEAGITRSAVTDNKTILPSFQRVVVAVSPDVPRDTLIRTIFGRAAKAVIAPIPVRPLFEQSSFIIQYGHLMSGVSNRGHLGVNLSQYICLVEAKS